MPTNGPMRHPATRALYDYWNTLRAGRRAPRRLEIQPARLGGVLLDTFILERQGRSSFPFRLAGTRVSGWFGTDLRGKDFLASWGEADRVMLERHLTAVTELGRVGLFSGEGTFSGPRGQMSRLVPFELVVLPLVHTGHAIDRLVCLMTSLDGFDPGTGDLGGGTAVPSLKLLAAEEIWPDGKPVDSLGLTGERPPVLHPHVRTARIVRDGRRQFRVYQGGRTDREPAPKGDRPPSQ